MEIKMKTMKYILVIICVACASTMMAVDYKLHQTSSATFKSNSNFRYSSAGMNGGNLSVSAPAQGGGAMASIPPVSFRSTSAMPLLGSSLSVVSIKEVTIDESGETQGAGPKRVPALPPDPFLDPLGDALLPLLLLVVGYGLFVARKRKALKNC